ncbi:DUF2975 domain-containing protein [Flavobacterium buctense]|uniref:DUF2975 domain-containing protein n=1 Tax=Flavobacterium buctense TaxID=1648146 RepID=A0ABU9E668_9FLAO|nr:DUF2975 domain-containing protein [Flavobacterium buctense]
MEIKISTAQILKLLYIFSWIIFIGLCIEAGGFLFNSVLALVRPDNIGVFWHQIDLTQLYKHDVNQYFVITFYISIIAVMKALIFYLIVKILHDKKLNLLQPFNPEVRRFIFNLCYLTLGIGLFTHFGVTHAQWLYKQNVTMPDIYHLRLAGGDVWLFMSVTLYVIAQIFKRGIEIQNENDLTI